MVDDASEEFHSLTDEQYEIFRKNVKPRYNKPTKKSIIRLAKKLVEIYKVPFFYYNNRTKIKNSGLKKVKIIYPIC